jgi:hypothetical protein
MLFKKALRRLTPDQRRAFRAWQARARARPGPAETVYIQAILLLLAHIRPIEARDLLELVVRSDEFRKERFTASGLDR